MNIGSVVKSGLCTGCRTCVSLCPNKAIDLVKDTKLQVYVPRLNENRCCDCSLCYKVCPGHTVDFKRLNVEIFGKEPGNSLESILLGNYLDCYAGYSTDHNLKFNSSSGGLVTQLLI